MSAFAQPESDSEDELPPGWEERATLGNIMLRSIINTNISRSILLTMSNLVNKLTLSLDPCY